MDKNPIALKVRVLEFTDRPFKGKDGQDVQYRTALVRFDGVVLKFTTKVDVEKYLDKDIVVNVEVRKGLNDAPKFSIVSVQEPK